MIRHTFLYTAPADSVLPYRNLAREELFLHHLTEGSALLYLWQNQNTVVIGRNQNGYRECRVGLLESEGGHLARRLSGGGAVFHDLGNLNYTILTHRSDFNVPRQTETILRAVRRFGIDAEVTGRNDIAVGGRKFSGNAYYLSKAMCYQHGTLLVKVDPERIGRYLSVSREKLASKGVRSVASRVTGLADYCSSLTIPDLVTAIAEEFAAEYGSWGRRLSEEDLAGEELEQLTKQYASDAWRYGESFPFRDEITHRFPWGSVQLLLQVKEGRISGVKFYTDSLDTKLAGLCESALGGIPMRPQDIESALRLAAESVRKAENPETVKELEDIRQLLRQEL